MVPESITDQRARGCLTFVWPDNRRDDLPYRVLRLSCPCADCRVARESASRSPREHTGLQIPTDLAITEVRPVGHYALQLRFNDGHDRGIFPWLLLRELCTKQISI